MSKLTKLVTDPRRFVLDSKPYRRYFLLRTRALGDARPSARLTSTDYEGAGAFRDELLADLARSVPILDVSHGYDTVIAVMREHLYYLTEYLHELGHMTGFAVRAESLSREISLSAARLFEVDDFLASTESFDIWVTRRQTGTVLPIAFQLWRTEETQVVGPVRNPVARRISHHTVQENGLFEKGPLRRATELHPNPISIAVVDPVDVVFTWVNHNDPRWRRLYTAATGSAPKHSEDDARSLDRYMNRDELKFAMRSIARYAPWVRKIFVVTNCSKPGWVSTSSDRVVWVDHREIIPEENLPTFNSHAIESRLHHVPELSNQFLYFNDDFFLMRPTMPDDYFHANGISKSFMEPYGVVNGSVHPLDPDYLNAARNGKRLLEDTFARSATALHKHTPYALRKDVLLEMEEKYSDQIGRTRASQFRTIDDVSTVSFLYHHYAYLTGRSVYVGRDAWLIKPRTPRYETKLSQLLEGRKVPISLCLNDGGGSAGHSHWDHHVVEFLDAYFSEPSPFES